MYIYKFKQKKIHNPHRISDNIFYELDNTYKTKTIPMSIEAKLYKTKKNGFIEKQENCTHRVQTCIPARGPLNFKVALNRP